MIKVTDLSKNFGELKALDKVSFSVPKGSIFGFVGANGAGKSTLMRIIAGIYTADDGSVLINDEPVYDNPAAKTHLVFVPDRMHLTGGGATIERMANFYASCYPKFSFEKFDALLNIFKLDKKRRVRSLSKGMVRQVQTVLALSCNADVLLFDETFDGLDPIVSKVVKDLFRQERKMRKMTLVMASHDLKELEDFCDSIGIIHKGDLLHSSEIRKETSDMHKIQCVFEQDEEAFLREHLHIVRYGRTGNFVTMVVKGEKEAIMQKIQEQERQQHFHLSENVWQLILKFCVWIIMIIRKI